MYMIKTNTLMLLETPKREYTKINSDDEAPVNIVIIEFAAIIKVAVDIKV
jgi:hypothetical protein